MDHLCGWEDARIGQAGHVVDAVPMLASNPPQARSGRAGPDRRLTRARHAIESSG